MQYLERDSGSCCFPSVHSYLNPSIRLGEVPLFKSILAVLRVTGLASWLLVEGPTLTTNGGKSYGR
jgi:hypothetical protein